MELGDLTLSQRDYADSGEVQPLVHRGDILLIAGEPIQSLGQDDIKRRFARGSEQRLVAGAQHGGAAHPGVTEYLHQFPSLARKALPT